MNKTFSVLFSQTNQYTKRCIVSMPITKRKIKRNAYFVEPIITRTDYFQLLHFHGIHFNETEREKKTHRFFLFEQLQWNNVYCCFSTERDVRFSCLSFDPILIFLVKQKKI